VVRSLLKLGFENVYVLDGGLNAWWKYLESKQKSSRG